MNWGGEELRGDGFRELKNMGEVSARFHGSDEADLHWQLNGEANSIAIIVRTSAGKHALAVDYFTPTATSPGEP